jgi:hypothetical protein
MSGILELNFELSIIKVVMEKAQNKGFLEGQSRKN